MVLKGEGDRIRIRMSISKKLSTSAFTALNDPSVVLDDHWRKNENRNLKNRTSTCMRVCECVCVCVGVGVVLVVRVCQSVHLKNVLFGTLRGSLKFAILQIYDFSQKIHKIIYSTLVQCSRLKFKPDLLPIINH